MFETRKVKLPTALHRRAEKAAERAGYSTLAEFVCHVLEREIERIESRDGDPSGDGSEAIDRRLEGLGYLG